MNKYLSTFIIASVVLIGGYYLIKGTRTQTPQSTGVLEDQTGRAEEDELNEVQEEKESPLETEEKEEDGEENKMEEDSAVKTFNIDAINYSYSIKDIRVKKGNRVKINLARIQGFHDLVIDELNASTKQLGEGSSDSVEFVADMTGTFEYYCSIGTHRKLGMVGNLIVE